MTSFCLINTTEKLCNNSLKGLFLLKKIWKNDLAVIRLKREPKGKEYPYWIAIHCISHYWYQLSIGEKVGSVHPYFLAIDVIFNILCPYLKNCVAPQQCNKSLKT